MTPIDPGQVIDSTVVDSTVVDSTVVDSTVVDGAVVDCRPPLRVVHGGASADEVAALVAVLAAAGAGDDTPAAPPRVSAWASRDRLVRSPLRPGPGQWRASALPR